MAIIKFINKPRPLCKKYRYYCLHGAFSHAIVVASILQRIDTFKGPFPPPKRAYFFVPPELDVQGCRKLPVPTASYTSSPDTLNHYLVYVFMRCLARCSAALTCVGAVPPRWLRAATDPSKVNTAKTSCSITVENPCNSAKLICAKSL